MLPGLWMCLDVIHPDCVVSGGELFPSVAEPRTEDDLFELRAGTAGEWQAA